MESNVFIKNNIEKIDRGEYTDFLNTSEKNKIVSILNKIHIKYHEFTPFEGANKTVIYTNKLPSISLIEFKCKEFLKHSDILGMLFSHNISPTKYGDIVIKENKYYLIVFDSIKYYLKNNPIYIKNSLVDIIDCNLDIISDFYYDYEELNILVSSLRLDNVVASITNNSRSGTDTLFKDKYILVNYENCYKKTYLLKEKDIISIRGYGKYLFDSVIKRTNKDKFILKIFKYK